MSMATEIHIENAYNMSFHYNRLFDYIQMTIMYVFMKLVICKYVYELIKAEYKSIHYRVNERNLETVQPTLCCDHWQKNI